MTKDKLIPYQELIDLIKIGFKYKPNSEQNHSGSVYYYENGKLYYDYRPMYSSSAHKGQILAATREQVDEFLTGESHKHNKQ